LFLLSEIYNTIIYHLLRGLFVSVNNLVFVILNQGLVLIKTKNLILAFFFFLLPFMILDPLENTRVLNIKEIYYRNGFFSRVLAQELKGLL
jgi:hypothetical protein